MWTAFLIKQSNKYLCMLLCILCKSLQKQQGHKVDTMPNVAMQPCIFTPHAQRERGKVIGRGVHIYIYMSVVEKNI